ALGNVNNGTPLIQTVTIFDDDTAAVTVTTSAPLTLSEAAGDSLVFAITLDTAPTSEVTVPVSLSTPGQCTLNTDLVLLHSTNYDTGVDVTVTVVDDAIDDDDRNCIVTTGDPTSDDASYDALTADDVDDITITIIDNDTAAIILRPTEPVELDEIGEESQVFTFTLAAQPTEPVRIPVSVSSSNCLIDAATVTLSAANYVSGVPITVTAVDDGIPDGDQPCNLITGNPTSDDANYNGFSAIDVADVSITIIDRGVFGFNLIANGTLADGLNEYETFGAIDVMVVDGVAQLTRTDPAQPAIFAQNTGAPTAAGGVLFAQFQLGNSSNAPKHVEVQAIDYSGLSEGVATEGLSCMFTVPAFSTLDTYSITGRASTNWISTGFSITINDNNNPSLLVDNILLQPRPDLSIPDDVVI
ncbi:MAG: hypothetical protein AAF653_14815, partial [Chloroflexota bacterium]